MAQERKLISSGGEARKYSSRTTPKPLPGYDIVSASGEPLPGKTLTKNTVCSKCYVAIDGEQPFFYSKSNWNYYCYKCASDLLPESDEEWKEGKIVKKDNGFTLFRDHYDWTNGGCAGCGDVKVYGEPVYEGPPTRFEKDKMSVLYCAKCAGKEPKKETSSFRGVLNLWDGTEAREYTYPVDIDLDLGTNRKKGGIIMGVSRKLKRAFEDKSTRLLKKYDVIDDCGDLTHDGREVVIDTLFEDKELRKAVVSKLEKYDAQESK